MVLEYMTSYQLLNDGKSVTQYNGGLTWSGSIDNVEAPSVVHPGDDFEVTVETSFSGVIAAPDAHACGVVSVGVDNIVEATLDGDTIGVEERCDEPGGVSSDTYTTTFEATAPEEAGTYTIEASAVSPSSIPLIGDENLGTVSTQITVEDEAEPPEPPEPPEEPEHPEIPEWLIAAGGVTLLAILLLILLSD